MAAVVLTLAATAPATTAPAGAATVADGTPVVQSNSTSVPTPANPIWQ